MGLNLILQGGPLSRDEVTQVAALAGANHIVTLGTTAWRFTGVTEAPIEGFCAERGLDWAWVPDERRLEDLRLIAMDMDSTLITVESIDEMGGLLGIKEEIAAITAQAMQGEIDYAESLRRRVSLLAGLEQSALDRLYTERVRLSPGAERLVDACQSRGIRTLLVSGGFSFFASRLTEQLGLDRCLSNELEIVGGRLTGRVLGNIVDGRAKAAKLSAMAQEIGVGCERTLAIGDGANDIPMLAVAGVSVAYRAKSAVREHATHTIDHAGLDGVIHLFL
ncbi:MAG: phosphoserine phosphatase SerB [Betaproteobacteria bacterium]|nr:phosphoserine phosphatase SerB [Betaproteobacteria bacterium]